MINAPINEVKGQTAPSMNRNTINPCQIIAGQKLKGVRFSHGCRLSLDPDPDGGKGEGLCMMPRKNEKRMAIQNLVMGDGSSG